MWLSENRYSCNTVEFSGNTDSSFTGTHVAPPSRRRSTESNSAGARGAVYLWKQIQATADAAPLEHMKQLRSRSTQSSSARARGAAVELLYLLQD